MTRLREIVQFVSTHQSSIPFSALRARFNGDLTGLRIALERELLEIRGDCYTLTPDGREFLERSTLSVATEKVCYQCQRELPAEQFWKNATSGDGLFDYCITCGNRKKRKAMEARRKAAEEAITAASAKLIEAANQWDHATAGLAGAWQAIMEVDEVIRQNMLALGTDNDSGRMHARTTFTRAAFVFNLAMSGVKWPQTAPFLREVNFPVTLAEYIGDDPQDDYISAKVGGISYDQATEDRRTGEGHAKQGDEGTAGHDPVSPRRGRRGRLPKGAGAIESGGVHVSGREVSAKRRKHQSGREADA